VVEAVNLHWITPSKRIKLINMALRLEHMAFIEVLASSFCSARKLQINRTAYNEPMRPSLIL